MTEERPPGRNPTPKPRPAALDAAVALLAALALACAGERPRPASAPPASAAYADVRIEPFRIGPEGVAERDPAPYLARAQAACLDQLIGAGRFRSVAVGDAGAATAGPGLVVQAEVVELRIVGRLLRNLIGGDAGTSRMELRVTLRDAETGAVLRTGRVGERTRGKRRSPDATLPERVGARVAAFVEGDVERVVEP